MHKGRVVFGAMDEVVFGRPAAEAIVAQVERLRVARALSHGQRHAQPPDRRNRQNPAALWTALRRHLRRHAAAHPARGRHCRRRAGARRRRRSHRHRRRRLDHRRRQGGAALPRQRCAPRRGHRQDPGRQGAGAADITAPTVRQISVPTTIAGGEFSAIAGVTNQRSRVKEMLRHGLAMPRAAILDPAITVHTPGMAVAFDRHPRRRPLRRRPVLAGGASLCRRPGD